MNEFRRDPITGRWVIISSIRDARPNHFRGNVLARDADDGRQVCPFCADQRDTPTSVAEYGPTDRDPWQVCVVPNRYPVVRPHGSTQTEVAGIFESAGDGGFHEVVIESPIHATDVTELSESQFYWMLIAYRDRMLAMRDAGMAFAMPMKNSGADAGASLQHTHSQIFGLPFVPPQVELELGGALRFSESHGGCVYCDLITRAKPQARMIAESEDFIAWCPYASRFGYETWVAPKAHHSRFELEPDLRIEKLGIFFRLILRKIAHHSRISAFNTLLHSLPFDTSRQDHYHWHIEILPRIAKAAGFEWGTGVHINTVSPEAAAEQLARA